MPKKSQHLSQEMKWTLVTNAPSCFERLLEKVLRGLHWKSLLIYLDDVIVFSDTFSNHISRLEEVFGRFREAHLKLKPAKCVLLSDSVKYLGHIVSKNGVSTDPEKVEKVENWPVPECKTGLKSFNGLVNYYRKYIEDYAKICKPLNRLMSGKIPFTWEEDCQQAFERLKLLLITAPILGYPIPGLEYILDTDASNTATGAVLSQMQEGHERVIAYYSKSLSPQEVNYCVTRKELLSVIKALKHFRPYLIGTKFRLRTDHASLIWLYKRNEPSDQVARWLESMAEFDFTLEHRAGAKHGNADGLSRITCENCKQCNRIEKRDGGPTHSEIAAAMQDGLITAINHPHVDCTNEKPVVCVAQTNDIAYLQQQESTDLAKIYLCVKNQDMLSEDELRMGSFELKRWNDLIPCMRLRNDDILEVRLTFNNKDRWVVACPQSAREAVIWETHSRIHSGVRKTTARLRLSWYWPGMTSDIKRAVL